MSDASVPASITTDYGTVTPDRITYYTGKSWFNGGSETDVLVRHVTMVRFQSKKNVLVGFLAAVVAGPIFAIASHIALLGLVSLIMGAILMLWSSPIVEIRTAGGDIHRMSGFPWTRVEAEQFVQAARTVLLKAERELLAHALPAKKRAIHVAKRFFLASAACIVLLGAIPLTVRADTGHWHVPIPVVGTKTEIQPDVTITATLTEYRIALDPARPTIHAGEHVRFVIENKGKLAHEFMITNTAMAGMQMNMKQMDAMSLATVTPKQLPPGATVTLDVVFKDPGTYELACHLPGHEAMKTTVTVIT